MGKYAMGSLKHLFKDRGIRLSTQIIIVQTLVFPIILYGTETCLSKRHIRKQLMLLNYGAEGKFLELPILYLDMKRNTEIIDIIQPKRTLESRIVKAALSFSDTLLD